MGENEYIKNDLEDYTVEPGQMEGYISRTNMMESMLPDEAEIEVHNVGSYQGTMGFVIELDGYIWLIKESYGSCSYCDGFIDSDKEAYTRKMMRNAYCFETVLDAKRFLGKADGYAWHEIKNGVVEILNDKK